MKKSTLVFYISLLILFNSLTTLKVDANVPGGLTGSTTSVTLTTSGNNIVMNNGIVSMTVSKTSATVTSLTYNGVSMFAGGFYWSWTPNIEYTPANCQYTLVADPTTNGGTYAEIKLVAPYTAGGPDSAAWDVEVHYSLLQGSPGFYAAAILTRPTTYPAYVMGEWRAAIKLNTGVFDWLSVDTLRNKMMATETDWENGTQPTNAPKEVRLLNSGIYSGQYECKYGYSADLGNLDVYGWSSVPYPVSGTGNPTGKNVGIWMTMPSLEYYNGGPMKRELTGHLDLVDAGTGDLLLLNMLNGEHYGMGDSFSFAQGEAFEKAYGPFFIYCNKYSGTSTAASDIANSLWQDAQNQASAEQGAWPYTWFNHAAYPQKAQRSTVSGTFTITDPGNAAASPEGMWIGLAPNNGEDFQLQAKTYQFWTKVAANGTFSIPNVRAGTYNLYAFGTGGRGTFKQSNIAITAGQNLNLGTIKWTPQRIGSTVWEIGKPDRDSKEFYNGTFNYSLWATAYINYPTQFPNGVNYTVGTSNYATDWNYAQVNNVNTNWGTSPWTINFNLNNAPTTGTQACLYMGLASNYSSHLTITVNGTQVYSSAMTNGSDAVVRLGSHGAFSDTAIVFNSNLLRKGANVIILNQVKSGEGNTIEYDYFRLEATETGNTAPIATITAATSTTFCTGGSVVLNANTGTGYTYQWNNNGTAIVGATAISYTATASASYTVTVTSAGLSTTSVATVVTVNALPSAPTLTTPVTYCQNATATALTATGTSLKWYIVSTGGTSSTTAPVPLTTTSGTTNYYVSQTITGCESPRATIVVMVNALPSAPTVTTPVTYCQNATATALTATGTSLKWYIVSTGGTSSTTAPVPLTTTSGTTNYYVSQTVTGCEGPRATIVVTVNALPAAPTVTTPVTYCQNETAIALAATGTSLKWYTVSTGGTSSTTVPVPLTTTSVTTNYYVSQTVTGCEGPRATIAVTVNALPSAPTVTTPVTYCQNSAATALTATGTSLKWYTVSTGGTSSTTVPVPLTTAAETTDYYVSQTITGCEGPRAAIAVTVNALPSVPTGTTPVAYCQNATATALTATGISLKWYTVSTGGTGSSAAPIPSTTATGTTNYYVSQTINGCEGLKATVLVTINSLPIATITPGSSTSFCAGGSVLLTSGTAVSYSWLNGNSQAGTNQTYTALSSGTYSVVISNASGCKSTSVSVTVTSETCDCAGVPNGTAVIDSCGNCVGGTTGLTACNITTGTINSIGSASIVIYPQPFEQSTKVELKNGGLIESIMVYSSTGSLVYSKEGINDTVIEIGETFSDGLYTVLVQSKQSIYTSKIVKM